jgi:hypothetical protein
MKQFEATLEIIGINPFVYVPEEILYYIFEKAGKDQGQLPICGLINGVSYKQTLLRYKGAWRLYVNTSMLKNSPKRIGERVTMTIDYDTSDRSVVAHPKWVEALSNNQEAQHAFEKLSPSLQKEIVRYFTFFKTEESIDRNIVRAINFLLGKGRFVGRDPIH